MRRTVLPILLLSAVACGVVQGRASSSDEAAPRLYTSGDTASEVRKPVAPVASLAGGLERGQVREQEREALPAAQIKVVVPPASPPIWALHERVGWAASLGLTLVGYLGVLAALRMLHLMRSEVHAVEQLAQAAADTARAATMQARAAVGAQRPWVRISVERTSEAPNTLQIVASNAGQTPAEIIDCPDRIRIVKMLAELHQDLWTEVGRSEVLKHPLLLMPGGSSIIQRFGRADAQWVCKTEERLAAVRHCEETIYLFGRVKYRAVPQDEEEHWTDWCFRYVHGEGVSELVMDGPFHYNRHT